MTALQIVQLIIALGPTALELIPELQAVWNKPELSRDEVERLILPAKKSYAQYRAEAEARHATGLLPGIAPA